MVLLKRFREDFWCNNNEKERNWIAMKEAEINTQCEASRKKCYDYIESFIDFDFNTEDENLKRNFPIITQNDVQNFRNELDVGIKMML